jgi:hypothetical protein
MCEMDIEEEIMPQIKLLAMASPSDPSLRKIVLIPSPAKERHHK